jgi:hypothetical protein
MFEYARRNQQQAEKKYYRKPRFCKLTPEKSIIYWEAFNWVLQLNY